MERVPVESFDRFLTEAQAARYLNVSRSWLQKARCHGFGPEFTKMRNGKGGIRYRQRALDSWVNCNSRGGKEVE